jgi:hypothetical protein
MRSVKASFVVGLKVISWIIVVCTTSLLICVFTFCCGLYIAPEIYQRIRLASLERGFQRIQHPPGTTLAERKSEFVPYAANYCAYFVGELREFEGERQEIVDFYTRQYRDGPFSEDLYIVFVEDEGLAKTSFSLRREPEPDWPSYPIVRPDDLGYSGLPLFPADLQGELYIVFLAHKGDFYFDYRCH